MVNVIYLLTSRDLCLDVWFGSGYGLVLYLLASCSPAHPLQMGTFLVLGDFSRAHPHRPHRPHPSPSLALIITVTVTFCPRPRPHPRAHPLSCLV